MKNSLNVIRYPCCSATLAATIFAEAPINVPFPEEEKVFIGIIQNKANSKIDGVIIHLLNKRQMIMPRRVVVKADAIPLPMI